MLLTANPTGLPFLHACAGSLFEWAAGYIDEDQRNWCSE